MPILPAFADDLFAGILLGTEFSPGVVTLSGHDDWENWKVQKAKGNVGATTKLQGKNVRQFQASFYLVQSSEDEPGGDVTRWEETFRPLIESTTNGPEPKALGIYHPDLAAAGITEVTSGGISAAKHDGVGGVTYVVRFLEYRPPKPKPPKKPDAIRQGVTTLEARDPNAEAKAQLRALVAQAKDPTV